MKTLTFILLLLVYKNGVSQEDSFIKQSDSMVANIDIEGKSVEKFRWLLGYIDYSTANNGLAKIIYSYKAGPREIIETFYIKDSLAVFVKKQATSYYLYGDSIVLLGRYYFEKGLIKYYSLYRDEEKKDPDQIQEALINEYNKTLSAISRRQRKKTAASTGLPKAAGR